MKSILSKFGYIDQNDPMTLCSIHLTHKKCNFLKKKKNSAKHAHFMCFSYENVAMDEMSVFHNLNVRYTNQNVMIQIFID